MAKPRVIIADCDMNYIIPIQQKFIEEYFEKIDLEIITDKNYFDVLFSEPQKADILIISEEFYCANLQKHNIEKIFLMTEQYTERERTDSFVNQIYKYTSIREIFNVIVGVCSGALMNSGEWRKETKIILIYSACGGVGRTTIALGICACLNKDYKRVLYINADRLQTFHSMLSDKSPVMESEVYAKMTANSEISYADMKHIIRSEGFSYVPPFKASLMSLGIPYSVFGKIALSASENGNYDYIIVDADTVFDEEKSRLIEMADKIVVVTKQNKASVHATNVLLANLNMENTDKYIFVCNDFEEETPNMLISPNMLNKFIIGDYVEHISGYDQLKINDLTRNGMQKIAFLVS